MLSFNIYKYPKYYDTSKKDKKELEYIDKRSFQNLSRYSTTKRIIDDKNNVSYFETINKQQIPESESDTFITVTKETENRLDLISLNSYGNPLFWWIIAIANNIDDPFDIPIGSVLRIPSIYSLYMEGSVLYD